MHKEAYRSADEIYVIGWSMPATDVEQVEIIREAIKKRIKNLEQLSIINYKAEAAYFDRMREIFGVSVQRLEISNNGFCEHVFEKIGKGLRRRIILAVRRFLSFFKRS